MAEPLLRLADVRAGYGDAVVLDNISLEVPEQGSLAVIIVRNGVGKSTLPRRSIRWRAAEIATYPRRVREVYLGKDRHGGARHG